jgi:heme A synthase
MRQTYRVLASLIALGVLVQAASVAMGTFQVFSDVEGGAVLDGNSDFNVGQVIHGVVGMILMPLLGLVLLGVSFAAARSVPQARKWAGIVLGLIVLQVLLAFAAFGAPIVGALHGVNAILLLGAAGRAASLTRTAVPAAGGAPGGAIPAQRSAGSPTSTPGTNLPA